MLKKYNKMNSLLSCMKHGNAFNYSIYQKIPSSCANFISHQTHCTVFPYVRKLIAWNLEAIIVNLNKIKICTFE